MSTRPPKKILTIVGDREGSCFVSGCTGSAVWAGHSTLEQAHGLHSTTGERTLGEQLRSIGYDGTRAADYGQHPLSAHFELHIEQGPRLQESGMRAAVVTGIQGQRRFNVTIHGEKAHAGSTSMPCRTDALVAAAKAILIVERCARDTRGVATVGTIHCDSGSANCVPGKVVFTIDLRHEFPEVLESNERQIRFEFRTLEEENKKLKIDCERTWEMPAASFTGGTAHSCISLAAYHRLGAEGVAELLSFAGHDSAMTSLRVPTAMLFVPSRDGISHAPNEFTAPEQWFVMSNCAPT
jgi:N-carbamoyl-L-amino-acid hydrolase